MKTLMLLPVLAIAAASPALAESCSTAAARVTIAKTLRLAAEQRPVNVTFQTRGEGVKMPESLKAKYSDDMTIILQQEFSQLDVKDDRFEVVMRFNNNPARLSIPYTAIKAFWDNSQLKCSNN
jgi:uncharacterized protein